MKSDDMASAIILIVIGGMFFSGYFAGRYSIKEDCDAFGAFKAHGVVYECKVKQ